MPIKMNKPGDTSFALTIEDRFDANEDHIVEIVDMDTRDDVSTIDGKPYTSIVWKYRVFDAEGVAFIDKVDGSPYEGWEFSSMALTPKAKARAWASAFLGHELSDDECDRIADNFDGAIVGKRARVSWKLEEKPGGTRIRFALLRPLLTKAQPRRDRPWRKRRRRKPQQRHRSQRRRRRPRRRTAARLPRSLPPIVVRV